MRNSETKRLGRLQIDHQLELGRLLDRDKRAPWMRPVRLVGGDAIRSSAFIARHRRRCQRRQLSLGATLPGVSEAIRIFGVRFFDQFTLTVAKPYIAFVAAGGDAPTWSM